MTPFPALLIDPRNNLYRLVLPRASAAVPTLADPRLRAFLYDSIPYYVLPAPTDADPDGFTLHDGAALLRHVRANEFDVSPPPAPCVPTTAPAHRRLSFFRSMDEGREFLRLCTGAVPEVDASLYALFATARLPVMPAAAESAFLKSLIDGDAVPAISFMDKALGAAPCTPDDATAPTATTPDDATAPAATTPTPTPTATATADRPMTVAQAKAALVAFMATVPDGEVVQLPPAIFAALSGPYAERRPRHAWNFSDMEVGASFYVPDELAVRARQAAYTHAHRTGRRYRTVVVPDGRLSVYRVK
jgi:hypothetical protein